MSDNQPFDPTATSIFGLAPVTEDVEEAPVALSARDREAVEALPAGSALLIVQRGPNTGARFLLDPEVTNAGRSPKADIFLDDVTVSRKHCQFIAAKVATSCATPVRSTARTSTVSASTPSSCARAMRFRSASTA